jgi:hypothetical protein
MSQELPASQIAMIGQVFKAVGKNIYLYQEVEKRIKLISAGISVELTGTEKDWREQLVNHHEAFSKKTMGLLMKDLLEKLYFSPETHDDQTAQSAKSDTSNEAKWRFKFSLQTTAEYIRQRGKTLEAFVEERNRLVHHYFEKVNFADVSMLESMFKELEDQHQVIHAEIKSLNEIILFIQESAQAHSQWWESEDGQKQWEIVRLQNSIPICFLERYSVTYAKEVGWSKFQAACSELKNNYPNEVDSFFKNFPFETLQSAATASGLFEFKEEKTAKGERLLYRAKATDYEYTTSLMPT